MIRKSIGFSSLALILSSLPAFPQLVISQVYGGGGNSGATYNADYIELFNQGAVSASLSGLSIQYASATGTGNFGVTNQITLLSGTIPAGGYFLVSESSGATGATLPAPDFTPASSPINFAAGAGKIVLVNSTTSLGCNGSSNPCNSTQTALILDLVGYGTTANYFEGSGPAPAPSATLADFRTSAGCTDTNVNSADFTTATPSPRNSATALNACGGGSNNPSATGSASVNPVTAGNSTNLTATNSPGSTNPPSVSYTDTCDLTPIGGSNPTTLPINYTVPPATTPNAYALACTVTDDQSRTGSFTLSLTVSAPPPAPRKIFEITGSGTSSPLAGTAVSLTGVVTAIGGSTGSTKTFYIESLPADRDSDPNTSEGLQIFIGSGALPACAALGNEVTIQGTVTDFVSTTAAPAGSTPDTELGSTSNCQVIATNMLASLPDPVTIDSTTLLSGGSATQARRLAGMRVIVPNAVVTGPSTGNLTETTETAVPGNDFWVTAQGVARPFHTAAGIQDTRRPADAAGTVPSWNGNPEAIDVFTTGLAGGQNYEVAVGTVVSSISGIIDLDTSSGQYELLTNAAGIGTFTPATPTLAATPIPAPLPTDLLLAEANIERFYDTVNNGGDVVVTPEAYNRRLNKLSLAFRNVLRMPDIIAIEEAEGPASGTANPAFPVLTDIVNRINSDAVTAGQGNPNYAFCGGVTNDIGLISAAALYRQDRVTALECSQYGIATQFNEPGGGGLAILNDRPPVVLRASVKAPGSDSGLEVRMVVNHLRSLNDIDTPGVANGDRVRTKRNEQAKYLANLVTGNLGSEQPVNWAVTSNLLVVGDMNAYQLNDGYSDSVNCIAGSPAPASQIYATAAQLAVSAPCAPVAGLSLTNLTTTDPAQQYSYTFNGIAQRIDHILVNGPLVSRVRQFAYERNNADFPEGPTYYNDGSRPERYSDHDAPAVYLQLPIEVTSRTHLNATGLVLNRVTHRYNGTITVTNTGAAALTGPVYVLFNNLSSGVALPDLPEYNGAPYATINLPSGLAPGVTSSAVAISFTDPSNAPIGYTTTRFDGTF